MTSVRAQYHPQGSTSRALADHVEAAIDEGTIEAGFRLPAIRDVAAAEKTSPATVAAAYKQLRERGLVVTRGRRGTIVAERARPPVAMYTPPPAGTQDLRNGNPAPELVPNLGPFLPGLADVPPMGRRSDERNDPELLELAAARFERDGIPAANLAVVGGALDGIERLLAAHTTRGQFVALEDPTFPAFPDLAAALRLSPRAIAIDAEGMRPDSLAAAVAAGVSAVIINPRGQNPTGASLTPGRAAELVAVLKDHPEVLVLEDDHMADIVEVDSVSVAADPAIERWAVVRSASKSLGPDLRLAVLAGDPITVSRMEARQVVGTGWVSTLLQRLVAAMWRAPEVVALHEEATATYRRRREHLLTALAATGIEAVGWSGFNVWVPVSREQPVVERLLADGWAVSPGDMFRLESGPGIRVTTARLEAEDADAFARDLAAALTARSSRGGY
jgi:DNA-binding transcriptional MocR family regulator